MTEYNHEEWCKSRTCEVCGRQGVIGVASSSLGAISFAFCEECARKPAEPTFMLSFTHYSCDGNVADWVRELYTYFQDKYVTYDEFEQYIKDHPEEFPDLFGEEIPPPDCDEDFGDFSWPETPTASTN